MSLDLSISPHGQLLTHESPAESQAATAVAPRVAATFARSAAHGLLHLATTEHNAPLPAPFAYAREFARTYLTRLCQTPEQQRSAALPPVPPPAEAELAALVLR